MTGKKYCRFDIGNVASKRYVAKDWEHIIYLVKIASLRYNRKNYNDNI